MVIQREKEQGFVYVAAEQMPFRVGGGKNVLDDREFYVVSFPVKYCYVLFCLVWVRGYEHYSAVELVQVCN